MTHPQEKLTGAMREACEDAVRLAMNDGRQCREPCRFAPCECARDIADAIIPLILKEAAGVCRVDFEGEMRSYGEHFAIEIEKLGER